MTEISLSPSSSNASSSRASSPTLSKAISKDLIARINRPVYLINALALSYVVLGYGLSIICISTSTVWVNLMGVVLLTHTLTWAAYFTHEFMHGTIFRTHQANAIAGKVMLFLTGSCYCRYRALARYHLAHHKNKADFSAFSIADFLNALPRWLRQTIVTLESLYFPVVNFILRWFCALSPFLGKTRQADRWRNGNLLFIRGALFTALGLYSWRALVLYLCSYICFINILRFIDCFQHTFEVFQLGNPIPKFSLAYEEANTFSNLFPGQWPWLNLLLLNFGYHNAHHRMMVCPWYLLPQLDADLYQPGYRQVVTLDKLIKGYHKYRTHRLFSGEGHVEDTDTGINLELFYGAIGVSFLVLREPLDWLTLPS